MLNWVNAVKILILGGGQIGANVAENLSSIDQNDVTIVDIDEEALNRMRDKLDILTVLGNAGSPRVLAMAGADDSDLLLALTHNDETNLVACQLASHLFNIPTRIARVRQSDYLEHGDRHLALELFAVQESICPEQLVTHQLHQLFEYPGSLQVLDFAGGKAQLVVVRARLGGLLVGKPLSQIREDLPDVDCRVCAIYRNDKLIIPKGNTIIIEGDEVSFLAAREHIQLMLRELRSTEKIAHRVMIAGGGNIGFRISKILENHFSVKLIENRKNRAEWLSENLNTTLVLYGSATDEALLQQENIEEIDIFCSLTNDDESNVMSALLAKRYGAKRVMALVNRTSYVDLFEGNKIDIVISPHLTTIGSILTHIRRGDVVAVHPLRRGAAEAIEAIVHGDKNTSKLVGRTIDNVELPRGVYISTIVREGAVIMAHHDVMIEERDHVIFFVARRHLVKEVEKLIQVQINFF